jgi:hypothetical protein
VQIEAVFGSALRAFMAFIRRIEHVQFGLFTHHLPPSHPQPFRRRLQFDGVWLWRYPVPLLDVGV